MFNKTLFYLLAVLLIIGSCQKNSNQTKNHDTFVYTFMSPDSPFSLKFNESDTVYLKNYKNESEAYALIKNRDSLEALLREVNFTKYDTLYTTEDDNLSHITSIQFYQQVNDQKKQITIIGDGPNHLLETAIRFNEFAKNLEFRPYQGKQDYGGFGQRLQPPSPLVKVVREAPQSKQKDLQFK